MNAYHMKVALLALGCITAACAPAVVMQPAQSKAGYQAGAELGAQLTHGAAFAGAADISLGFHSGLLQQPYTSAVLDLLSTARRIGGTDLRANLWTIGVRQPLPVSGVTPISVEGGFSILNFSGAGTASTSGGFIGGRATFGQSGQVGINVMARYHFQGGGFYQAGAGLTGPLGKGSGLFYQADYFRTGANGGGNTDTILFGVRWAGGV